MIEYTDFKYYNENYKGVLSQDLFNFYIKDASKIIQNNINQVLIEPYQDVVQYVTCKLVDQLDVKNKMNSDVSSISVDGVSKTYKTATEVEMQYQKEVLQIIDMLPQDLTRFV